ncbi:helix-turn-helix domain-containing protein [Leucobacter chromiireducens]|nr:helix-turn-helix transcriptional regulator [Leucobacter chromiireducens]
MTSENAPPFGFEQMRPRSQKVNAARATDRKDYSPLTARTQSLYAPIDPVAFDCVTFIVVRAGGARLFSEFGCRHVNVGDVVVLSANTLCGAEPEGGITTTTLYLDREYLIDQVFWQYAAQFNTRHDANAFLETNYAEPAQVVRLGEARAGLLMPWLDELTALSLDGVSPERFYRAQALLFSILDIVVPMLAMTGERISSTQRSTSLPVLPRHRRFRPLRTEAREVADMLRNQMSTRWTISEIAASVHLSTSQLRRIFVEAFGKSPIAYLTMLRVEKMIELLRTTDFPIASIASEVGWGDSDFAARQFRRSVGVSPSEYRLISDKARFSSYPE